MDLTQWAAKHGINPCAMYELKLMFGEIQTDPPIKTGDSEAALQTRIRLEASRKGARLFRNNLGAVWTSEGDFLRFGLANDSKKLNDKIKSSDLIGIQPIHITIAHVGHTIGQFVAREIKPPGWIYRGTPREKAQLKFIELITSLGGNAMFADREGTL